MTDANTNKPWLAMVVLGVAQLMITLDNSIVMIALPSAQADLGFDDSLRSWVISAYWTDRQSDQLIATGDIVAHGRR